jgi:hypothetical protein
VGHGGLVRHLFSVKAEIRLEQENTLTTASEPTRAESNERTNIIVNGRPMHVDGDEITYEQLVELVYPGLPADPNRVITITYRGGPRENPQGTLSPGYHLKLKGGMKFNVVATVKS